MPTGAQKHAMEQLAQHVGLIERGGGPGYACMHMRTHMACLGLVKSGRKRWQIKPASGTYTHIYMHIHIHTYTCRTTSPDAKASVG